MAKPILTDDLWAVIAPLLPVHRPSARGGRPRIPDRAALTGILFVLKTGIQWEDLPPEMDCGCGMSCWRRLRDWQRASLDSASVPSPPSAVPIPDPIRPIAAKAAAPQPNDCPCNGC